MLCFLASNPSTIDQNYCPKPHNLLWGHIYIHFSNNTVQQAWPRKGGTHQTLQSTLSWYDTPLPQLTWSVPALLGHFHQLVGLHKFSHLCSLMVHPIHCTKNHTLLTVIVRWLLNYVSCILHQMLIRLSKSFLRFLSNRRFLKSIGNGFGRAAEFAFFMATFC